ncbi:SRPBCC family protein [Streptomyces pactum]|uniref:SRPBCC family protein n=1 Tax=Streptomyces pactum TaxID=68249 RepID=UPI0036F4E69B
MAEGGTLGRMREQARANPGVNRLIEEAQSYVQERARLAVTDLGQRLGDAAGRLGQGQLTPGGPGGGPASGLRSPRAALLGAAASHAKGALVDKAKDITGLGKHPGKGPAPGGKSLAIIEDIDVGVPVREAYNQWTQFQEFSRFAKGVVDVDQEDDTTTQWQVKIAKSNRQWQGNITEQLPDRRIAWTTEGAKGTTRGVVTFHPLGENLTKVLLVLEYFPKGLVEKTGGLWRAQGRRARLDLKLYRAFVMMQGEATGGWRGEIRDGEVVRGPDEEEPPSDGEDDGDEDDGEPDDRDDRDEDAGDDRDAGDYEEDHEDEEGEEHEDDGFEEDEDDRREPAGDRPYDADDDTWEDEDEARDADDGYDEDEPVAPGPDEHPPGGGRTHRGGTGR